MDFFLNFVFFYFIFIFSLPIFKSIELNNEGKPVV